MATAEQKQLEAFKARARDIAERAIDSAIEHGAIYSNEMYHLCELAHDVLGAVDDKEAHDEPKG